MQTFAKKQMAVAVGAALAATAGGAFAASTQTVRTNGVYVASVAASEANKQALYSASGLTGATMVGNFALKIRIASTDTNAAVIKFGDSAGTMVPVVGDTTADSVNHILVSTADSTSLTRLLANPGVVSAASDSNGGYTLTINFDTAGATEAFKIDSAGNLNYSANSGSTWSPVKVKYQATSNDTATKGWYADVDGDNAFIATNDSSTLFNTIAATSLVVGNTVVPTPTIKTKATSDKVDGLTMETFSPLTGTSIAVAGVNVKSRAVAGDTTIADSNALSAAAAGSGSAWTIVLSNPGTDNWTAGDSVADAAAYSAKAFNTGVAGNTVPFYFNLTSGNAVQYTQAFVESTGSNAYLMRNAASDSIGADTAGVIGVQLPARATYTDGAAPVVVSANYNSGTKLMRINFSEPIEVMDTVGGAGTVHAAPYTVGAAGIQEAVEQIAYGTALPGTSMAAANFNADGDVTAVSIATVNGLGVLSISQTPADFLNQKLIVNKRLSVQEPGDAGASQSNNDTGWDQNASFRSVNDEILSSGGTINVDPDVVALAFDGETTAQAVMASDGKKVQRIDITYPYTISQDSAASLKDHFRLKANDAANGGSSTPNPTYAYLDSTNVAINGKVVSIALPTNLTLQYVTGLEVEYNASWGDGRNALKFYDSASSTSGIVSSAVLNESEINLPFYIVSGKAPLYTMEAAIDLDNASGNSKITAYLAKWLDVKVDDKYTASGVKIASGKVSDTGNKVATDLSLEINNGIDSAYTGDTTSGALSYAIATELNKDKPGLIPVVVELQKSNDAVNGGGQATGDAAGEDKWLQAHAKIGLSRNAAVGTAAGAKDPLYDVLLDPKTGVISGRLSGLLRVTSTKGTKGGRGLIYIDQNGNYTTAAASAVSVSVATDGNGKANMMLGTNSTSANIKNLDGAFVLAVLTDVNNPAEPRLITSAEPGMSNYLPFSANLITGKDGRVALPAIDVSKIKPTMANGNPKALAAFSTWQLVGVGALDRKSTAANIVAKDWPRLFVTLAAGVPVSNWTGVGDSLSADLAMTMQGNKSGVASEASTGDTTSTISLGTNANAARFAFAFANDGGTADKLFFLTKTPASTKLPVGWSLISAPASWATGLPADVSHALKVGAGYTTPVTWVAGDGSSAGVVAEGEPVFVYAKKEVTVN
jgi:hypothetical protein